MKRFYNRLENITRKYVAKPLAIMGLAGILGIPKVNSDEIHIPRDFLTIQSGIDATQDGDTILVSPGEYIIDESIDINKNYPANRLKNIIIRSENGPEETIIRGKNDGSIIVFKNGEDLRTSIYGFTLASGNGTLFEFPTGIERQVGGGIFCYNSSPLINNCKIINNVSDCGGGLFIYNSNPILRNCIVTENVVFEHGGGLYIDNGSPTIENCNILNNRNLPGIMKHGGGLYIDNGSSPHLTNCEISGNWAWDNGGGIYIAGDSFPYLNRCLFFGNSSYKGGAIAYCGKINLTNCSITDNPSEEGFAFEVNDWCKLNEPDIILENDILLDLVLNGDPSIPVNFDYSIQADPKFIENGAFDFYLFKKIIIRGNEYDIPDFMLKKPDYHLQSNSPCIDAGDPKSPLDLDGTRADIGAIFYDQRIPFIRGDANRDGEFDISDPVSTLLHLFGSLELKCLNAADSNADNKLDISDPIYSLNYLFLNGNSPSFPYPNQGIYDQPGNLGCREY